MEQRFSPANVHRLLRRAGGGKASGPDSISKELLGTTLRGATPSATVSGIAFYLKAIYMLGVVPAMWKQSLVVPLYKGKGSRNNYCNWRPISLLCFFRKISESCIFPLCLFMQCKVASVRRNLHWTRSPPSTTPSTYWGGVDIGAICRSSHVDIRHVRGAARGHSESNFIQHSCGWPLQAPRQLGTWSQGSTGIASTW